jgi:single-strand DNA-binding protein
MNKVILMGRLTRDPEVRYTQSAEPLAVASFSIAVDRPFSSNRDSSQPTADFINCACFGKRGENIGKYFKKGNKIAVVGRIQTRTWDDQNTGQKRYSTEVIVDDFEFCESKAAAAESANSAPRQNSSYQQSSSYQNAAKPDSFYDIAGSADDEDLPF